MDYYLKTKSIPVVFLDGWLVAIEKAAFGWKRIGNHSETYEYDETTTDYRTEYHDGIEWDITETKTERKTGITTYQDFYRISPFTFNPLFAILEFASGILSWIRRMILSIVTYIGAPLLVLCIIACFFDSSIAADALPAVGGVLALYVGLIVVPSLAVALFAFLLRKLFGIDKNLENSLRKNGYRTDW